MDADFAPFELAVKLKEKGYPQDGFIGYDEFGALCIGDEHSVVCAAPTISQVLKWLRNKKKIYVSILPVATFSTINKVAFYYLIEYNSTGETMESIEQDNYCVEWNDAALAGIEYTLDNLI